MGAERDEVAPGTRDGARVCFADGQRETFDLVVGADGAWSRVRPAVSSATPRYTGVTAVETSLDDVDTRHPGLARLIGDGSLAVYARAGKWAKITAEGLERLVSPDPADAIALFDEVQLSWLTASIPPGLEAVLPERYSSVVDVHVILRRDGKVLLLRRAGDVYATGLLCLPSGHLEHGEHVLAAAVRETREETGIALDPAITSLVLSIHQRYPEADHARVGFAFEPGRWQGEPVIGEPDKCSELIWANPDSLPDDTMDYTAAVIRAVQGGHSFAINGW